MSDLDPIVARPAIRISRATEPKQEEATVRFAPLAPIASFLAGPIFTRTRDIVAANMADLLDRSEDPSRMIRMIIVEMEETLVEVRATAARSIADIKEMRRACQRLDDMQHGWAEKAGLALEKGREDLARAALTEKRKAAEMAEGLYAEVSQIEIVLRGYEADIQRLQAKLAEARARQNAIASRFESAITRARTSEVLHGNRTQEAFAKFELLERRADFAEGRADALGLAGPKSLEEEIAELRSDRRGRCRARRHESRARGDEVEGKRGMSRYSLNRKDKKLAGVASTLGDVFNIDPTFIRIGFVAAFFLISWEFALIAYVAAGIYLHLQKRKALRGEERMSDFDRMDEVGKGRTSIHDLRTNARRHRPADDGDRPPPQPPE